MHLVRVPRPFHSAQQRLFVSTVLLSRTWENETVVELRKEAKVRGLSTKGNKPTLIARIQQHEKNTAASTPLVHTPGTVQSATTTKYSQKTWQAASPGIPLPAQPDLVSTNPDFRAIKLPDLSRPPPNAPVQIPYVPDFWNSARPKADGPSELKSPKLHVVSGSVTHYDGGPTHNLEKLQEGDVPSTPIHAGDLPVDNRVGFWPDFWESLGLPRSFSVHRTFPELARENGSQTYSRPLTDEEKRGLYILLGVIGGSWLVGGFVDRTTALAEERDTQNQH